MLYSGLNDGQRTMIESNSVFLADYSEAVGKSGVVVHAIRLHKDSDLLKGAEGEKLKSNGFEQCSAAVWFETSTARMTGEEANRFAENAANS